MFKYKVLTCIVLGQMSQQTVRDNIETVLDSIWDCNLVQNTESEYNL